MNINAVSADVATYLQYCSYCTVVMMAVVRMLALYKIAADILYYAL